MTHTNVKKPVVNYTNYIYSTSPELFQKGTIPNQNTLEKGCWRLHVHRNFDKALAHVLLYQIHGPHKNPSHASHQLLSMKTIYSTPQQHYIGPTAYLTFNVDTYIFSSSFTRIIMTCMDTQVPPLFSLS